MRSQAAVAAPSATAPAVSTATPSSPSPPAAPTPSSPTQPLFPVMRLVVEKPVSFKPSSPRPVFVSLSSDLRLLDVKSAASVPTSLLDFRHQCMKIALDRLQDVPIHGASDTQSLESAAGPRVCAATHANGPAVRVSDGSNKEIVLIADTAEERDALLRALRLRVAPWFTVRAHMKDEMTAARRPSSPVPSSSPASAACEFVAVVTGDSANRKKARTSSVANRLWENARKMSETSLWVATFAQGTAGISKTAEEVERLAKPLGGLAVVGCALSLVALAAKAVNLIALERRGRVELGRAENDLREASESLVRWLFLILSSGFVDDDGLVYRVFDVLEECWLTSKDLEKYLLRRWTARVWSAEDVGTVVAKVEFLKHRLLGVGLFKAVAGVNDQLQDLEGRITDLEVSAVDHFRIPTWTQIENGVGLVADAATFLGRLKAVVLPLESDTAKPAEGDACEASGPRSRRMKYVALASVSGEGGVGKTSTCRLLCEDDGVRKHFSGGAIVWIDVGKSAAEGKVKEEVRRAVNRFGGEQSARKVLLSTTMDEAVVVASQFFSNHRILLVIDNVWENPAGSKTKSWAATLAKIASHSGSAVIATTRSCSLARSFFGVEPLTLGRFNLSSESSPDLPIAENFYDVLLKAPGDERSTAAYKNNRRTALVLSCGLVLGIKTIACLILKYRDIGDEVETVLARIKERSLRLVGKEEGGDEEAVVGHPGLFAAMEESLRFLDDEKRFRVKLKPLSPPTGEVGKGCRAFSASYSIYFDRVFSSRYAALHMLQACSPVIAFSLLCHLWHVATVEEVKFIVHSFVDFGLGRVEVKEEQYFVLHDLQYEFCSLLRGHLSLGASADNLCESRSPGWPVNGHALFLSSCKALLLSKYKTADARQWARFCFEDSTPLDLALREYLPDNLLRHLCSAEPDQDFALPEKLLPVVDAYKQEVLSLLCNFCWLRGRFNSIWGRNSLLRDFRCVFESCLIDDSEVAFLEKLRETLMLVREDELVESDGTLASSLVQLARSMKTENTVSAGGLLEQLVRSAEEEVRGSWLKPVGGCSNSFEPDVVTRAFVSSSCVEVLSDLGDETHFVSLSGDGTVRIHEVSNLSTVLVIGKITESTGAYGSKKIAVAQHRLATGCSYVFTGEANGAVLCYEVSTDDSGTLFASCRAVGETSSPISSLFASRDGKFVAAKCDDGNVCVWELDGDNSSSFVLKNKFFCSAAAASKYVHLGKSAVVSGSGDFVAACTYGDGLYVWREGKESAERVDVGPTSFTFEDQSTRIIFVSLSSDETSLIVLFNRTAIGPPAWEIWNIEAGERRLLRVELPELRSVYCANLESSSAGEKFEFSLLVGGYNMDSEYFLAEYSIGNKHEMVRRCLLAVLPESVCRLEFSDVTRLSAVIVGGVDGSVRVLGAAAFDAGSNMKQSALLSLESGMRVEESFDPTPLPELADVSVVAVMPDARRVVAGHVSGRLSLWSAKDGSFQRLSDVEKEADWMTCIGISGDESVAVTGHGNGTVLVWETRTWTVGRVLNGHSATVFCVAALRKCNRICSVDRNGEWRVWDAVRGGTALGVIETGLKFDYSLTRAFVSSDGGHLIWARNDNEAPWKAKVIDVGGQCVVFESDEHREWKDLCAEVDASLLDTEPIGSWKETTGCRDKSCELRCFDEESGWYWLISSQESRVLCQLKSAGGSLSDRASIKFDSKVWSIAVQWLPHCGQDRRRRAIVACRLDEKSAPAILHFITPKV